MPNFANWLGNDKFQNYLRGQRAAHLAALAWRKIQDKPAVITILRRGQPLAPQTVRLENSNYGNLVERTTSGFEVGDQDMHVLGLKDHPSLPDLDIRRGDIFIYDGKTWKVANIITTNLGWIQAYVEAQSS